MQRPLSLGGAAAVRQPLIRGQADNPGASVTTKDQPNGGGPRGCSTTSLVFGDARRSVPSTRQIAGPVDSVDEVIERSGRHRWARALAIAAIGATASFLAGSVGTAPAGASSTPGYWLGGDDGGVFAFGAPFFGSQNFPGMCQQGCSVASWPYGHGYWVLTTGESGSRVEGGLAGMGLNGSGLTWAPLGLGDGSVPTPAATVRPWRVTGVPGPKYGILGLDANGSVYSVNGPNPSESAQTYGSMAGRSFVGSMVGIASTSDGKGYWLVASDGGVFAFGDAAFEGSMGGRALNAPIVAIASTSDGQGYWLVGADGGVFAFGDAPFEGSMAGKPLAAPVVGIAGDASASGYWLAGADGGVFAFGAAPFLGSMSGHQLNSPITSIASNS